MVKHLCSLLFLGLAALASAADDLIINRVLINPQGAFDDGQGLELFEIKNVGTTTINLATSKVALVAIDNETGKNGELDFWHKFTGSLAPGETLTIQDKSTGGTATAFSAPNATAYGGSSAITAVEFFPLSPTVDISNSGHNYLLVKGFDSTKINPATSLAYAFGAKLDLGGTSLKFDFKESTGTTTDDLWTSEYDAMVVAPDTGGLDDYTTYLSLPHKVAGIDQGDWTPDYIWRLHYNDGSAEVYDKAMAADLNALSGGSISLASTELNTLDGSGWTYTGTGTPPGVITGYAARNQYGNWTSWTGFTGVTIGGRLYVH